MGEIVDISTESDFIFYVVVDGEEPERFEWSYDPDFKPHAKAKKPLTHDEQKEQALRELNLQLAERAARAALAVKGEGLKP